MDMGIKPWKRDPTIPQYVVSCFHIRIDGFQANAAIDPMLRTGRRKDGIAAGNKAKSGSLRLLAAWFMQTERVFYFPLSSSIAAWAAARRATGTRNGEQLT